MTVTPKLGMALSIPRSPCAEVSTLASVSLRRRRYPMERLFVLTGLALASALCLSLEFVREVHYAAVDYRFLVWNLVLAWIPLTLALLVYDRYRHGTPLARTAPALALWLLFLPNAPYILTD